MPAGSVVYDNTASALGFFSPFYQPGYTAIIGDDVTVEQPYSITHIDILVFQAYFEGFGTVDAQVRLYAADGAGESPGTLLWDSGITDNISYGGLQNIFSFDVPSVLVEDPYVWTIELSDVQTTNNYNFGLLLYGPPAIGGTEPAAWIDASWITPGTWVSYSGDYGAKIFAAVPGVTIIGGNGKDVVDATHTAADQPLPTDGADTIDGGNGKDTLSGLGGDDSIIGGRGKDALYGDDGDDDLSGGAGDDRIDGGAGADVASGGSGSDRFVFHEGDVSNDSPDQIVDFSHRQHDRIDLSGIDAIDGGADDDFSFIGPASFGGSAGELRYETNGGGVTVEADTNGDGSADFRIDVLGITTLRSADFVL